MTRELPEHQAGSGNVFADAGLPDAEVHLLKAQPVSRLDDLLRERGLSQSAAAKLLGVAQPDLSNVLRGRSGATRSSGCCASSPRWTRT